MTYAKKTLSEIKLIHGNYGNFIKGQKLDKKKEKKYKMPPYQDLAASTEIEGETLDEKCWPGYEKKGMKTMFGKRYPNCVKKKKTRKEDFSDWRSELDQVDEGIGSALKAFSKLPAKQRLPLGFAGLFAAGATSRAIQKVKKYLDDKNIDLQVDKYVAARQIPGGPKKIDASPYNAPHHVDYMKSEKPKYKPIQYYDEFGNPRKETRDELGLRGVNAEKRVPREKYRIKTRSEATMTPAQKRKDTLLKKKYEKSDDMMKSFKDQYGKEKGKNVFYAFIRKKSMEEENIQEILDKKDVPHVKKLVGKLRKGSKTHAKQADDLEKAMNEEIKTGGTIKKPTVIMPDGKELPGLGGGGGGTNAITGKAKTKTFKNRVKDVGKILTFPISRRNVKPDPTEKFATEDTAIESELVIQDWNVDDIKFTEIETVDIIKAKPLKENVKKKIIVKGLKALGNLSKKTKIKSISPKPVATPGTTFATGGKFPPGSFSNVSDYAGAVPKATKTGGQMYSTTYDLGTRLSPGAIKPVKGAFKGGGSLKGRIDPSTGDRVSFKQYKEIMKGRGKKYYEPVKGAKFGDKIMATKRSPLTPLKQEKLPLPKPRKEPKFKVRDDATFGDQIMVRKNEPFSRNFTGRTPMPKPLGKAKYEVGKKGVDEFRGGDMYSKVGFRSFKDKKYGFPGLKKPASAPKDASRLYEPKGYRDYTPKRDMPTTNPEAGRVLFGKGELKTGVKKKGKTIYKENVDLDEGAKRKIIKKLISKAIKKVKNKKVKVTGDVKPKKPEIKFPVRDAVSKKLSKEIQTKSIVNQTKKANELARKPIKGTTPVKVDLSKKLDIDKYIGGTPIKDIPKKKFVGKRPTGTFTDDPPPVKPPNMDTKLDDYLFGPDKNKPLKIFDKRPDMKSRKMYNPNTGLPKPKFNKKPKPKNTMDHYDWRDTLGEDWQKVNRKDKTDGLSKAAVKAYRRENPGSKLKTAVTKDPKKLKKGSKDAKRRLSFCRRMKGMKKKLTSAKTRRDPDSRINKALRRWNC